jgi:hypothetical protein
MDKLNYRRKGRLLNLGIYGGALIQQRSPTTDQEVEEMVG